jgi:Domain of unknown function (DUF4412)
MVKPILRVVILTIAVTFIAFFLAAAQVPKMSPFSADMEMSSTRANYGSRDTTGKIYIGSGHMRLNMDASGGHQTAILTDFTTQTVDILMVQQQMYMEHKTGQPGGRGPGNMTRDLHSYDPNNPCANQPDLTCKKIGVEEVNGRTCDHWKFTHRNGEVADVWIDQKLHFPIKLVSPDSTMLLTNISEGEPDASLFVIPDGYRKMDMSGMGGTMPPDRSGPPQ